MCRTTRHGVDVGYSGAGVSAQNDRIGAVGAGSTPSGISGVRIGTYSNPPARARIAKPSTTMSSAIRSCAMPNRASARS
jgi:hypothetical protein